MDMDVMGIMFGMLLGCVLSIALGFYAGGDT
jgi:hypothetical protein